MQTRFARWWHRAYFPSSSTTRLGFGAESWYSDPTHYEGWEQLRDRYEALGQRYTKSQLAYQLSSNLLDDVIVAAGGVERSISNFRSAVIAAQESASSAGLKAEDSGTFGFSDVTTAEAWFAFADVLFWSRTVVERLDRPAASRRMASRQGLVPALKPKRLRRRCETLLSELRNGPVGNSRALANFVLHSGMMAHPFTGAEVDASGVIRFRVPDAPSGPVSHWYLLTWAWERDGIVVVEDIWRAVELFLDELLAAFERAVPKRLRR